MISTPQINTLLQLPSSTHGDDGGGGLPLTLGDFICLGVLTEVYKGQPFYVVALLAKTLDPLVYVPLYKYKIGVTAVSDLG